MPTVAVTNELHEQYNIGFHVCLLSVMFYVHGFIKYSTRSILIKSLLVSICSLPGAAHRFVSSKCLSFARDL